MAIGGFVVGASAMAAVLVHSNILLHEEEAFLQGVNITDLPGNGFGLSAEDFRDSISGLPDVAAISASNTSGRASVSVLANSTAPSMAPSSVKGSHYPTYNPMTPGTAFPTYRPTSDADFPTDVPTTQSFTNSSDVMLPFMKSSFLRSKEVGVRLKLFWDESYYWQESTKETW